MAEWLFDRNGQARIILDRDKIRNNRGEVIAWISGDNLYSLEGRHIGWFEDGVVSDSCNRALAFLRRGKAALPSVPGIGSTPGMPGFAGVPGRPGLGGVPGRPGRDGWSSEDLDEYFNT